MKGFRKDLDRLRETDSPPKFSISDQLRFFSEPRRRAAAIQVQDGIPGASLPPGRVVSTRAGSHYLIRETFPVDHFHGKVRLGRLSLEDLGFLLRLAGCEQTNLDAERIVFLDTETTGVHGGAGMCPFMIGVGFYRGGQFEVVQYFIRDFDEESSMLIALTELLAQFDLIVTYNGRSFDLPLVENRCVLARLEGPFDHLSHFDLLFTARRLWRAGHGSCRLTALEHKLVGFIRGPDIHGSQIPRAYFDYLRSADATCLATVFSHNVYDILSLAALAIHASDQVVREPAALDDPRDVYSLGRVFDSARECSKGIEYYEAALEGSLPPDLGVRALERLSVLYRRRGDYERSLACCDMLMESPKFSLMGYEGASIIHERRFSDCTSASQVVDNALRRIHGQSGMERRKLRLEARRARLQRKMNRAERPSIGSETREGHTALDPSTRHRAP